uniref:Rhodanese domain-containing protein n=2 Tax=Amphimedon queenslandica TaxID=400682 RepID=A0A1X7T5D4_AMPQE
LNSKVKVTPHHLVLNSTNALNIIKDYDVILDASDNVATRYLLNDSCVLLKKPLVSGSALRFEGQLTVYNYKGGPCYRCLFPCPPPPHCVTNCSEGGVVGVVPGVIGSLQALEAMKIITDIGDPMISKLLLFDGFSGTFRHIKLRERNPECSICGDDPTIKELIDYEQFCGSKPNDKERQKELLTENQRISCADYKALLDEGVPHLLLDVREPVEYDICHLPHSHNIPLSQLQKSKDILSLLNTPLPNDNKRGTGCIFVC